MRDLPKFVEAETRPTAEVVTRHISVFFPDHWSMQLGSSVLVTSDTDFCVIESYSHFLGAERFGTCDMVQAKTAA